MPLDLSDDETPLSPGFSSARSMMTATRFRRGWRI
jgi:hypothetical protein